MSLLPCAKRSGCEHKKHDRTSTRVDEQGCGSDMWLGAEDGHAFCAHNRCASHRWVRRQSKDLILPPFNAALSAASARICGSELRTHQLKAAMPRTMSFKVAWVKVTLSFPCSPRRRSEDWTDVCAIMGQPRTLQRA
jgi:hypothetical protein